MNETMTDRELDAWLAEYLFGTLTHEQDGTWGYAPIGDGYRYAWIDPTIFAIPAYSSTGEGMLMVIEAMKERGFRFDCTSGPLTYRAEFTGEIVDAWTKREAQHESLPRAVAEAAKAALEAEA